MPMAVSTQTPVHSIVPPEDFEKARAQVIYNGHDDVTPTLVGFGRC